MTTTQLQEKLTAEMPTGGYPSHPAANLFPELDADTYKDFFADLIAHGMREPIVLIENGDGARQVLDGRTRQRAALEGGVELRWRIFDPDPEGDGESPTAFVVSLNLRRRHLTTAQRAAIAADIAEQFSAEAEARRLANLRKSSIAANDAIDVSKDLPDKTASQHKTSGDEFSQETGYDPADESQARGRGKSAAQAAKAVGGVSQASVERAIARKKADPEAHAAAKAGRKEKKAIPGSIGTPEYEVALARIKKVCGDILVHMIRSGEGGGYQTNLQRPRNLLRYVALSDEKMLATRALLQQGWDLDKAMRYKAEKINRTHRVSDLYSRATYAGGSYTEIVEMENQVGNLKLTIEIVDKKTGLPFKPYVPDPKRRAPAALPARELTMRERIALGA